MNSSRCPDLFGNEDMEFGTKTKFLMFLIFDRTELLSLVLTLILIPTQYKYVYRKAKCGLMRGL